MCAIHETFLLRKFPHMHTVFKLDSQKFMIQRSVTKILVPLPKLVPLAARSGPSLPVSVLHKMYKQVKYSYRNHAWLHGLST